MLLFSCLHFESLSNICFFKLMTVVSLWDRIVVLLNTSEIRVYMKKINLFKKWSHGFHWDSHMGTRSKNVKHICQRVIIPCACCNHLFLTFSFIHNYSIQFSSNVEFQVPSILFCVFKVILMSSKIDYWLIMFSGDCTGEIPEIIMESSKYIHASRMLIKIQRLRHYGKIASAKLQYMREAYLLYIGW